MTFSGYSIMLKAVVVQRLAHVLRVLACQQYASSFVTLSL